MPVYQHFIVVYESSGNDVSDTQVISQSFSSGILTAYNSGPDSISDAVTQTYSLGNVLKPGTNYTVHYVVLDDSSATASSSATFTAATDSEILNSENRRLRNPLLRM